jgi:hypothetical protein
MGPVGRRRLLGGMAAAALAAAVPARAAGGGAAAEAVVQGWYRLILELVRHTPTYSPPVASRAFALVGIALFEAAAAVSPGLRSLGGRLAGLDPLPAPAPGAALAPAVLVDAALAAAVAVCFGNTGPTGQRAIRAMTRRMSDRAAAGVAPEVAGPSAAFGRAVAAHVLAWAEDDGGATTENMGFPLTWTPRRDDPAAWVPTSLIAQQQAPLLPGWGDNRPFALASGAACALPPPPPYSEAPGSAFRAEAEEVLAVSRALTDEQRLIARFWSDDPMLSPTPPGHWIVIALGLLRADGAPLDRQAEVLARLGIGMADAAIACWHSKYAFDLLRPVTYIRRVIEPGWEPLLITPPFPEYPSGHSTLSGAAATVLAAAFGAARAFDDDTHVDDGLPVRRFEGFWQAAEEAALSRLYGGIHFRSAIARGLEQGRCVGEQANALALRH